MSAELPPGFTLDAPQGGAELPPGFTLDPPPSVAETTAPAVGGKSQDRLGIAPAQKPVSTPALAAESAPPATWGETAADIAKTIPSAAVRGVSNAIGLPNAVGHGMRYLNDQARQALGYEANPEYVAGTGAYATPLDVSSEDVRKGIERATGPLYEPQTLPGRLAGAGTEIAAGSLVPIGAAGPGVRAATEVGPYLRNWATSSFGAGTAAQEAKEQGAGPGMQLAAGLAGGLAAPSAANVFAGKPLSQDELSRAATALAAKQEGIDVPRAVIAGPIGKGIAAKTAPLPIVGTPLQEEARASLNQTAARAAEIADQYGSGNRAATGEQAKDALRGYIKAESPLAVSRAYNAVDKLVTGQVPVPLTETTKVIQKLRGSNLSEAEKDLNDRAIATIEDDAVIDKNNIATAPLTYPVIKSLRTTLGKLLDNKLAPEAGDLEAPRKALYKALTSDLESSIKADGGQPALDAWQRANKLNGIAQERRSQLGKIIGVKGDAPDEQVYDRMIQMASDAGGANIKRLTTARKAAGPDAWNDLTSAFIHRLGYDPASGQWSPDRFLSKSGYGGLSPEGRQLLFNSTGRSGLAHSLDNLQIISRAFSDFYKMGNPSGTAGSNFITGLIGGGGIAGAAAAGGLSAAVPVAATMAGGLGASRLAAQWFASPANVDKIVKAATARLAYARNPNPTTFQRLNNVTAVLGSSIPEEGQPLEGEH